MPPRPTDPRRISFGAGKYEVDPDWSYYGSLIFISSTGQTVGWINGRAQTGWQVFHTQGHLLGSVLMTGQVNDFRGAQIGQGTNVADGGQVLTGVGALLDAGLDRFE